MNQSSVEFPGFISVVQELTGMVELEELCQSCIPMKCVDKRVLGEP